MNQIPNGFSIMLMILMITAFVWIFAEVGRRASARGTAPRFFWATIERGARYPALGYMLASIVVESQYGSRLYMLFNCLSVALWCFLFWEKQRDGEDDDWWSQMRKRIGARLRSANAGPATATGSA